MSVREPLVIAIWSEGDGAWGEPLGLFGAALIDGLADELPGRPPEAVRVVLAHLASRHRQIDQSQHRLARSARFASSFAESLGPRPGSVHGQTSMQMPQPLALTK